MPLDLKIGELVVSPRISVEKTNRPHFSALQWTLVALPLGYLWFRLLNNLRLEWATNPQYSYGLVVPLLALGLLLRRWYSAGPWSPVSGPWSVPSGPPSLVSTPSVPLATPTPCESGASVLRLWSLVLLFAFLYLPTRLVEEATPEWRPIEWMLAFEAVGLTLCLIYAIGGPRWVRQLVVPVAFILVAVPWPTLVETPLIQGLSRFNSAMVVEVMGMLGVPAVQHGNVIEVSTGAVGINDACSGIRSLQSSLMVSIFFGEFFRLGLARRLLLVPAGLALAMFFNLCRASFLTYLAATRGLNAISQYHDSAGFTILLACMACVWAIATLLRSRSRPSSGLGPRSPVSAAVPKQSEGGPPVLRPQSSVLGHWSSVVGLSLSCWLLLAETGVWLWYHLRESKLTPGPEWTMVFPVDAPSFRELPINSDTRGLLRFDEGKQATWTEPDGSSWSAFYFNWLPGRVSSYLAKRHTPDICLPAAGTTMRSGPKLMLVNIHGLELPVRHYVFDYGNGPIQVYQCHWEAGVAKGYYTEQESSRFNLIRGIWAGRGIHGQKVVEIIIQGMPDAKQAKQALVAQLNKLIKIKPAATKFPKPAEFSLSDPAFGTGPKPRPVGPSRTQ